MGSIGYQESEEHITERLNDFLDYIDDEEVYQTYENLRNVPFPYPGQPRMRNSQVMSDILLPDTFRQDSAISEKYRKYLPGLHNIALIGDTNSRTHWAMSSGYERHLIKSILKLDNEMINRQGINPILD